MLIVAANDILFSMEVTSLYLHIPFCKLRCNYCDFNTYAGVEKYIPEYVDALCKEVNWVAHSAGDICKVHTIYFGGGTPSLLSLDQIGIILHSIKNVFSLQPEIEITLEANPGTVSQEYLIGLKALGVNRLSLGMQSAHDFELNLLNRIHSFNDVIHAVNWARTAGFQNVNVDLIYGLPDQSLDNWRRSIELALELKPEHFSLYALTLEDDVPLAQQIARGVVSAQDVDLAADMYELAEILLGQNGYESYEISNWARVCSVKGLFACKHNLQYWRGKPYFGLGAGAHGYINHIRTVNQADPKAYIELMQQESEHDELSFPVTPATLEFKYLTTEEEVGEFMMMGLRLTQEGVSAGEFFERFDLTLARAYGSQIDRLIQLGLLEWVNGSTNCLRLTKRGRLLGNQVFCEFI